MCENARNNHIPGDYTLVEPTDSDTAQTLDTHSSEDAHALPPDVLQIVASLETQEAQEAVLAGIMSELSEDTDRESAATSAGIVVAEGGGTAEEATPTAEEGTPTAEASITADTERVEAPVEEAASMDEPDLAPETEGPSDPPAEALVAVAVQASAPSEGCVRVPWWPFIAYIGAWLLVSGAAAWLLLQIPQGEAVYGTDLYRSMVLAGLALTAAGPCLIVAVWLATLLRTPGRSHAGLFTGTLLKGALATLGGVATWWVMLVMVDMVRLGRPM